MATKTAKPPTKTNDELLGMFLTRFPYVDWDKLHESGASDDLLRGQVYVAMGGEASSWGEGKNSLCFSRQMGIQLWFGTVKFPKRLPDLCGDRLLMAVRRIFKIELPRANGSSPAKPKGKRK